MTFDTTTLSLIVLAACCFGRALYGPKFLGHVVAPAAIVVMFIAVVSTFFLPLMFLFLLFSICFGFETYLVTREKKPK